MDGDGDLDVVGAAGEADDITWWENDGTPANGGWTTHTIDAAFDEAYSVAAADLDGDGDLDVLGAGATADDITWWENDGTPSNGGWTTHTIDGDFNAAAYVAAADLDGDGDLDVLGAAPDGDDITWWESDGTPANGGWTTHTIDGAFDSPQSAAAADLDGDGDLDVLGAAGDADDITWWENDGTPADGGWITHTIDGAFDRAHSVAAADLDGDGDLDVLGAADIGDDITWWESDGTPADGGWITHTIDGDFDSARRVTYADLDGDGDLDVLGAAYAADAITWWENDGTPANGGWTTHTIDGAFDGASGVATADLDSDGDLDVLGAARLANDITWWENDGTPANGGWTTHTVDGAFGAPIMVTHADLDGDGDLDVLGAAFSGDDITWWENDGTPANGGWITHTIDGAFDGAHFAAAADLDGDGDLDVLGAALLADDITWWENRTIHKNALLGGTIPYTHTIDGAFDGAAFVTYADLDMDGDLDVLGAAFVAYDITWWESDGTPADGGWTTHTISGAFDGANSVAAADLDGDGDLDVLGSAFYADNITWWESDGTPANGGWTTHTIDGAFDGANSAAAVDLDGDGDLDVLGAARYADDITWWESDGTPADGGWTTHTIDGALDLAVSATAADLDGDGDLDVLGAAVLADDITWWSNHGGQFTLPTTGTAPAMINAGTTDDFVKIVFTHNGRTGDNDEELATFQLRFEETAPVPGVLTTAEANAIIDEVRVYLDTGNGTFEGSDTLIGAATVTTLALDGSGDQIVSFPDGNADAQLSFATGTKTYFAVLKLTTTYPGDPARNGITAIRMTHITEASSTGEDAANDLPLGMAYTANTQSSAGGTMLQGPLAVTINLFTAEASGSGGPAGPAGWLLRFGALGAAMAAAWTARRRRRTAPGEDTRGVVR